MLNPRGPCFAANPDVSGIGVRTAIYAQNLLSFGPALLVLKDRKVTPTELETLETQSTTILITAFAILLSAIIQARTIGISNYHTSIVLYLSWMNNTNLFIYLLLYVYRRVNLSEAELADEVAGRQNAASSLKPGLRQRRARWILEAKKALFNPVIIIVATLDENDQTVLHNASQDGYMDIAKYLVVQKADLNMQYKDQETLLHIFAKYKNSEMIKYLAEHKADLNVQDARKKTVLHMSSETGDLEMVKYLAEHGADLNVQESGDLEMVKYLAEHKADLNVQEKKDLNMVKFLAEHQANLNMQGKIVVDKISWRVVEMYGISPACKMDVTFAGESLAVWMFRVDTGIPDGSKKNVLHFGAQAGSMDIVRYCIEECKMDVTAKDEYNKNVLHLGAEAGSMDIVRYCIEECKMDVTAKG
ncbi:hypothetical protein DXG01_009883 [Tephrocybe rancida]|nr:hypothetical protein DXG01_009883 [Tephrocybe rancida]